MILSFPKTARTLATMLMLLAMGWLSVSLPIIHAVQREISQKKSPDKNDQQQSDNTADTTEESKESKANFPSEEFLHEYIDHSFEANALLSHVSGQSQDNYSSFFAETDIKPPRA